MKTSIAIIFGGQSSEKDISVKSALYIINLLDTTLYNPIYIGITSDGSWLKVDNLQDIESGQWIHSRTNAYILPDAKRKSIMIINENTYSYIPIDIVFPILHGIYGEDGSIQGLLTMAQIPYVGCGIIASSLGMDKIYTKIIVDSLNIDQAKYILVNKDDLSTPESLNNKINEIENMHSYPVFIKPSNAGSSFGVNKAHNKQELINALQEASKYDKKILVEEFIDGREIECAILGYGSHTTASVLGEVISAGEFYDFNSKYNDIKSKTIINPELDHDICIKIQKYAISIFNALDGFGISRVDFFYTKSGRVIFNEINTMPGFTNISMYPMLWNASGINPKELVNKLILDSINR